MIQSVSRLVVTQQGSCGSWSNQKVVEWGWGHFSTLIAAAERRKTSWNLQENNLRLTLTFHHFSFKTGITLWRRG